MKLTVTVLGMLIATSVGFAQNQEPECPTISMSGPAGITRPGDQMKFSLELNGSVPRDLQYKWAVSNGMIVEGQNTSGITVVNNRKTSVTATVEITGLAEGCAIGASETVPYCEPVVAILVAEASTPVTQIDRARLNKLAAELAIAPNTQGYLIEYFPSKTSQKAIDAKIRLTLQHLKKSVDETRITIVTDTASNAFTKYYIVPPGASNPTP